MVHKRGQREVLERTPDGCTPQPGTSLDIAGEGEKAATVWLRGCHSDFEHIVGALVSGKSNIDGVAADGYRRVPQRLGGACSESALRGPVEQPKPLKSI